MRTSFQQWKGSNSVIVAMCAAFDMVDHEGLLYWKTLQNGWNPTCSRGTSKTNMSSSCSSSIDLEFGIPQGSCVGRVFYSAYARAMQDVTSPVIYIHSYADYHGLKKYFADSIEKWRVLPLDSWQIQLIPFKHGWTVTNWKWAVTIQGWFCLDPNSRCVK